MIRLGAAGIVGLVAALGVVSGPALAQGGDAARFAATEVRLGALEEEMRRLTGRIDEIEFYQRQMADRLDQLVAAVDGRLRQLESMAPQQQSAAPAPQQPSVAEAAPPPAPAVQTAARETEAENLAPGPQTLGRIPAEALLGLPEAPNLPDLPAPSAPPAAAAPPSQTPAKASYGEALDLLRTGDYLAAEEALTRLIQEYPDDPYAVSAAYWLAETFYVRKDFPTAAASFARNFRVYGPEAPKAADNLLKLGMSLNAMGDQTRACQTYDELRKRYPDAPVPVRQAAEREWGRAGCA